MKSEHPTPRPEAALSERLRALADEPNSVFVDKYRGAWTRDVITIMRDAAAALVAAAEREQESENLRQLTTADALKRIEAIESQLALADLRDALLVAKWRADGIRMDTFHATMGVAYKACADELEAALSASPSTDAPAAQGTLKGSIGELLAREITRLQAAGYSSEEIRAILKALPRTAHIPLEQSFVARQMLEVPPDPLTSVVLARPGPVPGHVAHEAVGIRLSEEPPTATDAFPGKLECLIAVLLADADLSYDETRHRRWLQTAQTMLA